MTPPTRPKVVSMRRLVSSLLALALLAACQAELAAPKKPGASATPRSTPKVAGSAAPSASPTPGLLASRAPSFAPVAATAVSGLVKLDAAYMVAAGAGNLVAAGAGNIVAAGAGNLVGADGGTLIGPDGASLVGPDGASLIGPDGASLVGPDGASLVGPDGASYRLPFGVLAADPLPPGTQLPASRMRVRIYNLETGAPVLAARDPAARAGAYVLTDAQGRYQAPVLADSAGNVLVVADVIGKPDARLRLGEIVRPDPAGATAAIDEDLAVVTNYLRLILFSRLREYIRKAPEEDGVIKFADTSVSQAEQDLANRIFGEIIVAAKAAHVENLTPAQLDRLVGRMGDAVLAHMPISTVAINPAWSSGRFTLPAGWTAEHPAYDAVLEQIRAVNQAAARKMAQGPFTLTATIEDVQAPITYTPRKPADVGQFLVSHYIASTVGSQFDHSQELFTQLGLPPEDRLRLKVGMDGFLLWAFLQLASDASPDGVAGRPGLRQRLVDLITASAALEAAPIPQPETDAPR